MVDLSTFRGKNVLVTGHTGFKGTWLSRILIDAGANLTGFSLPPADAAILHGLSGVEPEMRSIHGDIRDRECLLRAFDASRPEIVLHLAAQPIVRASYDDPAYTYETNVMGTVNVLEAVRRSESVRSVVNVTTDKVYRNDEWVWGYRETDVLDGHDPYSNSKSCSELVTRSYVRSFLRDRGIAVTTARAGNVIGGGDFAKDRIIPDCISAAMRRQEIQVRNPHSTRPYQHVLEPIMAYLTIASRQLADPAAAGEYNVGPDDRDCATTERLVNLFCKNWGDGASWSRTEVTGPHEASFLKLDCSRFKSVFGWSPVWTIERAVSETVRWTRTWLENGDIPQFLSKQASEYLAEAESARRS